MADSRGVAYGLLTFVAVVALGAGDESAWLVLSGFPPGFVVGYRAGGVLRGVGYGVVVGFGIVSLLVGVVWYAIAASGGPTYPGVGLNLAAAAVMGAFFGAQSAVGGAVGGLLG